MNDHDQLLWTQVLLWRFAANMRQFYWGLWAEMQSAVAEELARSGITGKPVAMSDPRVAKVAGAVKTRVLTFKVRIWNYLEDQLAELYAWEDQNDEERRVYGFAFPPILSWVRVGGATLGETVDAFMDGFAGSAAKTVGQGIVEGSSLSDILDELGGVTASPGGGEGAPGTFPTQWRKFEAIVDTSVLATWTAAHTKGAVVLIWVATLDTRTCSVCTGLHGLSWNGAFEPIGHKEPYPGPSAHFRCRCTTAAGASEAAGPREWQDWLAGQPVDTVKQLAGPVVASDVRRGRPNYAHLTEQWSRPLDMAGISGMYTTHLRG